MNILLLNVYKFLPESPVVNQFSEPSILKILLLLYYYISISSSSNLNLKIEKYYSTVTALNENS